jgi:zinc transporter ZupT
MKRAMKKSQSLDILAAIGAGIFAGAAIFEIIPDTASQLGWLVALLLSAAGFVIWYVLKLLTNKFSKNAFAITASLAIWFHSALEGAVTAVGLRLGGVIGIGIGIVVGMILHLLPEFFAVVAILKSEGFSLNKSVMIDVVTIIVLLISFGVVYMFLPNLGKQGLVILESISAGAFLYIAGHSLLKRLRLATILAVAAGMALMLLLRVVL